MGSRRRRRRLADTSLPPSPPDPTADISVSNPIITVGQSTTLSWLTTNADSQSINQGIGSVAATGNQSVSPTVTTTYTLTAVAAGRPNATDQVTVTVNPVQSGTLNVSATLTGNGTNNGTQNLPATVTSDGLGATLILAGSSTQGGIVNMTVTGLPTANISGANNGTAVGQGQIWLTWYGWNYGFEPTAGTYNVNVAISDTFGNSTNKSMTLVMRQVMGKAGTIYLAVKKVGTNWVWPQGGTDPSSLVTVYGHISGSAQQLQLFGSQPYGSTYTPVGALNLSNLTVQWYVDGVALGSPRAGNATVTLDTTVYTDGPKVFSVLVLADSGNSGTNPLIWYRVLPSLLVVRNSGTAPTGPRTLPVLDMNLREVFDGLNTENGSVIADYISFPGTNTRRADDYPYPYQYAAPAHTLPDPTIMRQGGNWFLETVNQARNSWLDNPVPSWFKDQYGIVYAGGIFSRAATNSEDAEPLDAKSPWWCGYRNDNSVSPYTTFQPVPGGDGWVFIQIDGRIGHLRQDGSVRTICGYAITPASTAVPTDPYNTQISLAACRANQMTLQGDFSSYPDGYFDLPNDLVFDPNDPKILYIADTENWNIAQVTFSNTNFDNAVVTLKWDLQTYHPSAEAYSMQIRSDGVMWYVDRDRGEVMRISAAGVITKLCDIQDVQVCRLNSRGKLIVASATTSTIYEVDPDTPGTPTVVITTPSLQRGNFNHPVWLWLDVDKSGNIGSVDSIYFSQSIFTGDSTYGIIGLRSEVAVVFVNPSTGAFTGMQSFMRAGYQPGVMTDGVLNGQIDPWGHYVWAISIDDDECRFITTGFGNIGLCNWRAKLAGDPTYNAGNVAVFERGIHIHYTGTTPCFSRSSQYNQYPRDIRPSFTNTFGRRGIHYFGSTNLTFDDLQSMADNQIAAFLQAGGNGSVPRPELTGNDLRDYIYFIRRSSIQGNTSTVTPGATSGDTTAPTISNVVATPGTKQATITFDTDENAICMIVYGPNDYYGFSSGIESGYSTSHSIVISGYNHITGTVHYQIIAKDVAGNYTERADATTTFN